MLRYNCIAVGGLARTHEFEVLCSVLRRLDVMQQPKQGWLLPKTQLSRKSSWFRQEGNLKFLS